MQGNDSIPQAMEFENLVAAGQRPENPQPINGRLYALSGRPGLWRRIGRTGRGAHVSPGGGVLALFGQTIIELNRDREAEAELLQAGFAIPSAVITQPDSATIATDNGAQAHPVVPISQPGKPSQPIPSQPRKPSPMSPRSELPEPSKAPEPPDPEPALHDEENQDVPPMTAAEILAQHGQVSQREQEYG